MEAFLSLTPQGGEVPANEGCFDSSGKSRTERGCDVGEAPRNLIEGKSNINKMIQKQKITEDLCGWSLVRAAHVNRPRDDDEEIENEAERGNTRNDQRNLPVDLPKVTGEGTTQQK